MDPSVTLCDSIEVQAQSYSTFRFRRTLAYWIGVLYMEGAFVLILAASLGIASERLVGNCSDERVATEYGNALVSTPYFIGGALFTIACYISVVDVLNLANGEDRRMSWCLTRPSQLRAIKDKRTLGIVVSNLFGALCYNVNGLASVLQLSSTDTVVWVLVPGVVGGIGFVLGGFLACDINGAWQLCATKVFFLSWSGLMGGVLFLVASSFGAAGLPPESQWWCFHIPFLAGSILFCVGGQVSLWMWKCEQYGLMFAPTVNQQRYANTQEHMNVQEDYGCGRPSTWQLMWITVYVLNASASLVDIGAVLAAPSLRTLDGSLCLVRGFVNVVLSHGVILLCAVIQHVPRAKPYGFLVMYMQLVLLLYSMESCMTVAADVYTIIQCPVAESHQGPAMALRWQR
eukprot:TRINITY_DN58938_c0_g1_i1.p1 TRINITY_DN58938_c0_g1~~TRINITY_DN58938_c0_g1_i1.p1  ORF type:complete len:401 (-),score=13.63 TRINITY_DN58938_c0_g1_i1:242-1444(-)